MILLNLELFLLTLRREREEKADDSKRFELTEETAHLKSSRLIQVVHYMQEHVQEQIDMNTLCDVFYMSRSTLQHLFHKEFGCGPMEYGSLPAQKDTGKQVFVPFSGVLLLFYL